jgi:hypothetical protein
MGKAPHYEDVREQRYLFVAEENHKKTFIQTAGVQVKIQSEHLLNASPKSYPLANLLSWSTGTMYMQAQCRVVPE